MFKIESVILNPEYEEIAKEIIKKNEAEIMALLADAEKRLGEGRTADVCFIASNNEVCIKVYKKPDQIVGADFYLPPVQEMGFLEDLQFLDAKVRVPKVYASFKDSDEKSCDFLMMETLKAVSVDDVLQGRAKLPKNFDFSSFRVDLLDFVQKMHELGVYHRDLHEGNIMIDKESGQAYIIDFGAATEFRGEPEPGERGPYHITKNAETRILTSDEAMVKSVVKKLGLNLTVNS